MKQFVIFVCYSRKDEEQKEHVTHIIEQLRCVTLEVWSDSSIAPGEKWEARIRRAIYRADAAIFLVSNNFLESEFITEKELPLLADRQNHDNLEIIPVIMEDCPWQENQHIKDTQALSVSPHGIEVLRYNLRNAIYAKIPTVHRVLCGQKFVLGALFLFLLSLWVSPILAFRVYERPFDDIPFVCIPSGRFMMGSTMPSAPDREKPLHEVQLGSYCIGKYEISVGDYERFKTPTRAQSILGSNRPLVHISWNDAKKFCEHLRSSLPTEVQWEFSLPTEAQWEFAARAGSVTRWSFGEREELLGQYGWYSENSGGALQSVGTRRPNAWGIHDMHGNAWEWVADHDGPYPVKSERDPKGPAGGDRRVLRGGAYDTSGFHLRSAYRTQSGRSDSDGSTGFRCVAVRPEPKAFT